MSTTSVSTTPPSPTSVSTTPPSPTSVSTTSAVPTGVLDRAWDVSPRVSIRPEPFGALLYHFGTRRLSFLKDRRLLDVVQRLGESPDARTACVSAGLGERDLPTYERALARLAATDMLQERR